MQCTHHVLDRDRRPHAPTLEYRLQGVMGLTGIEVTVTVVVAFLSFASGFFTAWLIWGGDE